MWRKDISMRGGRSVRERGTPEKDTVRGTGVLRIRCENEHLVEYVRHI